MLGINKTHSQSICTDSSYTKGFSLPNSNLENFLKTPTLDNGMLINVLKSENSRQQTNCILKLKPNGDLDWNLALATKDTEQEFKITNLLQLKNGEYIVGGFTTYRNYANPDKITILKISALGNILWQKQLNNNYGSSISQIVRLQNIQEGYNGDIIALIHDKNSGNNQYILSRMTYAGDVIWSNAFYGKVFLFQSSANITANDGALHFWGVSFNNTGNCFIFKEGLSKLKFDYNSGFPGNYKAFCFTPVGSSIRIASIPSSAINEFGNVTKRLNNGNTVVFLQDFSSKKNLIINLFDSNYNFIKGTNYTLPDDSTVLFNSIFVYDVNVFTGEITFGFKLTNNNQFNNNIYSFDILTLLDQNLELKMQKIFPNFEQGLYVAAPLFLNNGILNILYKKSKLVNNITFNYLGYNNTAFGVNAEGFCNAKDTIYGQFIQNAFLYSNDDNSYDSVKTNVYQSVDSSLFIFSTGNFLDSMECLKISICDSLKINGPANFCLNTNDTLKYSFYKNTGCLKEVEWQIDTSFAVFTKTLNDTSIGFKFKKAGSFLLKAQLKGCGITDSLRINIRIPQTNLKISADSLLCPGNSINLLANKGFAHYRWSNGSIADIINVSTPGQYNVIATDSCGNSFKDSINIKLIDTTFNLKPAQICNYDTLTIQIPNSVVNLNWQPNNNSYQQNNLLKFFPDRSTIYNIQVSFINNCTVNKNFNLKVEDCPETIFFPNSFTPNNDGLNDIFKPIISKTLSQYNFVIYNRLGQKIFETNNQQLGWNGTLKGLPQNTGSFVWVCKYKFARKPLQNRKGSFTLIR